MIPIVERTPQGFAHRLRASVESVTDLQGAQLTYSSSRQDHSIDLKIYVPSAVDASRTVVIVYRLKNAIRFFEEHDELYWNVTGDEWPYPILKASATIDLPRELENLRSIPCVDCRQLCQRRNDADSGGSVLRIVATLVELWTGSKAGAGRGDV